MGEVLLKQGLALLMLLVFGGVLAALSAILPRWGQAAEGAPESRSLGVAELPPPAPREVPAPAPPPPVSAPAAARREGPAPLEDDQLVAAAVGLALALFQQEGGAIPASPPAAPERGASPWVMAGRWQAMQRRLGGLRR